jgi:primase-polymerase (primpol)-like protein
MEIRRCEHCEERLGARHAHHARYCSTRCRVAAHRARRRAVDPVPEAMTRRRQWVRHTESKLPLVADAGRRAASSTDPETWRSYSAAKRSRAGVGIGFVLSGSDRLVCIDLDHAIADGQVLPWARAILDRCPATYVELSPSGTGLHVWGYGPVGRGRKIRRGEEAIEIYGWGRYITVTGKPLDGAPSKLADLSKVIEELL